MDLKFQIWGGPTWFNPHLCMIYGALSGPIAVLHCPAHEHNPNVCVPVRWCTHTGIFSSMCLHNGGVGFLISENFLYLSLDLNTLFFILGPIF